MKKKPKAADKKPKPVVFKPIGQGTYYGYKRLKSRDDHDAENNPSLHNGY